jgi:hypothetical protein
MEEITNLNKIILKKIPKINNNHLLLMIINNHKFNNPGPTRSCRKRGHEIENGDRVRQ